MASIDEADKKKSLLKFTILHPSYKQWKMIHALTIIQERLFKILKPHAIKPHKARQSKFIQKEYQSTVKRRFEYQQPHKEIKSFQV